MAKDKRQKQADSESKLVTSLVRGVRYLERELEQAANGDPGVTGFSVRSPDYEGGEYLMVLRRHNGEGKPEVAFHAAMTLAGTIAGAGNRVRNGSLKWKDDKYANG